ncbi:MAG: dihydroorotase [Alkalispirochaetaceae bacterium]
MTVTIRRPDDFHIHLRQGEALASYAREAAAVFARAMVMPNTLPPVVSARDVLDYRRQILDATKGSGFEPLMTFKLLPEIEAEEVGRMKEAGVIAGKLYPRGATTNAEDGALRVEELFALIGAMEEAEVVLSIHGEDPDAFSLDREYAFLPAVERILEEFPRLRVVLEHISDARSVAFVREGPDRLAATITVHHLYLSLDDVVGSFIMPHHFCKPIAKRPEDRGALVAAALSGDPRFFLGTDSAPHPVGAKECSEGCAGVYTAPVAMPLLAMLFERHGGAAWTRRLEDFTSRFGAQFYRLPLNGEALELRREEWKVPERYGDVVPFRAGAELSWQCSVPDREG